MKTQEIVIGIKRLLPDSEFSFENGDYSTINWIKINGEAPTLVAIEKAYQDYVAEEKATLKAVEAKKQEVLSKLGLTADEVTALLA